MSKPDSNGWYSKTCVNCKHKSEQASSEICYSCFAEETVDNKFPRHEEED